MEQVVLTPLTNYERTAVETALRQLLSPLGGMSAFVKPGQRVLLKPNLLAGKAPEKAVTTHPEIVRAVIRLAQEAGGVVSVGDSPGIGAPRQVAERCGILAVVEECGARFAPFADSRPLPPRNSGGLLHHLELASDLLDAEVVINLPKLKTHQMMGLTCAVKNLFGAVVGLRKPRLHLQAGADKALFARMLLDIATAIPPALNIVDAVVAMEGDGPGSGDPVQVGVLLAGVSPVAVDTIAAQLVGLPATQLWTVREARQRGLPGSDPAGVELIGPPLATVRPAAFRPAKTTDIHFGLPGFLHRPLLRALSARPVPDYARCRRCGICVESCPPQIMSLASGRLTIDEARCIRCFCCQELCPYGALQTRQGWLLRLRTLLRGYLK